ncbi:hypothetical protein BRD56_05405 [Thermoplasmatales archaeon SW_10_69_26]|nr:MAG: hypothetical protein BRD56_05405 [Thermoplasmatales archaeon SW_10_69_26]
MTGDDEEEEEEAAQETKTSIVIMVALLGIIVIELYAIHHGLNGVGLATALMALAFVAGAFLGRLRQAVNIIQAWKGRHKGG